MSKISQQTAASSLTGTESVPIVQSGNTRKVPVSNILTDNLFTPSGAGAVARSVQAKLRDGVSVKDFGAVGDGVADDTAAIQAAITYAVGPFGGEVGKLIYFPTGIYKLTSKLTITQSGISWYTDGEVRFTGDGITGDYMLGVGGNSGSPISNNRIIGNFIFFRSVTNAGGGCIEWSYANYGTLAGVRFYNGLAPLYVHNNTGMLVEDLGWFETISGGIGTGQYLARFAVCPQLVIRKLMNFASFATKANTKVIIDYDCDDVKISECTVGQISLTRTGGGGTFAPRWVSIDKCYGESAGTLAAYNFDNCKSVKLSRSTGNTGLVGVNINTNALGVNISRSTFLENQNDGILIQGGSYLQIENNDISANNGAAGASFSGIRFSANADHVDIRKNRIKNHLSTAFTHAYGILTTGGGTIDSLNIEENDIANFVTAAFTDNAGATNKNSKTWTPTVSGAAITVNSASYSVGGQIVMLAFDITWPATADATAITIAGMTGIPGMPAANSGVFVTGYTDYANAIHGVPGTAGVALYGAGGNPATALTNANLSGKRLIGGCIYHI